MKNKFGVSAPVAINQSVADDPEKEEIDQMAEVHYDDFKRMDLIKMSNNNKYFLFYDNKQKRMKVYIIQVVNDENGDPTDQIQFHLYYTLDHNLEAAKELFKATKIEKRDEKGEFILNEDGERSHAITTIDELKKEIFDQNINVSVEDYGGVRCTFNDHNKLDELDVKIKVYAGEF